MYPLPQCQSLQSQVEQLLQLLEPFPHLRTLDTRTVKSSLKKAIAPNFDIVFAGAFSAGKSMLINAVLERELLYSAEGHATGTECRIAYAEPHAERVVLTFLSGSEICEQVVALAARLDLPDRADLEPDAVMVQSAEEMLDKRVDAFVAQSAELLAAAIAVIQAEGGESKSDRAKQATALKYLIQGFEANHAHIDAHTNRTLSMEQLHLGDLQEAAGYARRGVNSAVLKRIEYYCHHPLLQDGNVLIDTPGIDAPVRKDAELTYAKIQDPDTSAVVCVLKAASAGDMTTEETELLEMMRRNVGIRDRVFYAFNRIDESWYNSQLRQRLEQLIYNQFRESSRVYQTSGLLGFWGSQVRQTGLGNRFGLDSLFAQSLQSVQGQEETPPEETPPEETPQFVNEFNRYCASSGKLPSDRFRVDVRSYETPNQNYVRILGEQGSALVEQLIHDSGIDAFRTAVTRYLLEEKRPQLLVDLADDLQPLCIQLRKALLEDYDRLRAQPTDIEALKGQELKQLSIDLQKAGQAFQQHLEGNINQVISSSQNQAFEKQFGQLQRAMVQKLDHLLKDFSVGEVHRRAQSSHRRNSVVPLLGILAEAFYYLANGLEEELMRASEALARCFFEQLRDEIPQQPYYRQLFRMLGNDSGIEALLDRVEAATLHALTSAAQTECDRYVRECPEFFADETASLFQLQQTLQQACQGYDYQSMIDAEPAIRQLLKMDFEQKVSTTVMRTFRQTINQTLNIHLLPGVRQQVEVISEQYDRARQYMATVLQKEAEEKLRSSQRLLAELEQMMDRYNESIAGVNGCLEAMGCDRQRLPLLELHQPESPSRIGI
jgi:replication fork clamp-binding protein CrfC